MSIRTAFKDGRIVGGVLLVGVAAAVGFGTYTVVTTAIPEQPAATVETVAAVDLTAIPYINGLADEQETEAAAAEAARVAAEAAAAEAARVAAEQSAAAEAERVAAEQAAAVEDEPTPEEPAPSTGAASGTPLPFYPSSDPENATGGDYADPAGFCASGSASTVGGVPTCD